MSESLDTPYPETKETGMADASTSEEELIKRAVVRLNGHILGFVLGFIGAIGLFVATVWLVLKGGDVVGPHLNLLGHFFIGYSVSWIGSFIGAAYAFVAGYLSGLIIGWIYNAVVLLRADSRGTKR